MDSLRMSTCSPKINVCSACALTTHLPEKSTGSWIYKWNVYKVYFTVLHSVPVRWLHILCFTSSQWFSQAQHTKELFCSPSPLFRLSTTLCSVHVWNVSVYTSPTVVWIEVCACLSGKVWINQRANGMYEGGGRVISLVPCTWKVIRLAFPSTAELHAGKQ